MTKQRFKPNDLAKNRKDEVVIVIDSVIRPYPAGKRTYAFRDGKGDDVVRTAAYPAGEREWVEIAEPASTCSTATIHASDLRHLSKREKSS